MLETIFRKLVIVGPFEDSFNLTDIVGGFSDNLKVFQPHHFLVYHVFSLMAVVPESPFLGGQDPRKALGPKPGLNPDLLCSKKEHLPLDYGGSTPTPTLLQNHKKSRNKFSSHLTFLNFNDEKLL